MYQTIKDFLLSLSPEERKHFIEVDLPNLLMNQQHSVLKRTTLKLSTDLSEIEMRKEISETMGVPIEQIPEFDFNAEKVTQRNKSTEVDTIIKDYKAKLEASSNVSPDKYDELYDVGKFILSANNKFKIDIPNQIPEFPDFIISNDNQKIGLEHTRL